MSDRNPPYDHIGSKYDDYSRTATLKRAERHSISLMVGGLDGERVLDLACGLGFYTRLLKQHGAGQVIGVDISPEMIRIARQHEEAEQLGIAYHVGNALELPDLGSFDLITAIWLLNYAKTKDEPSIGQEIEVKCGKGEHHRTVCEGEHDTCTEFEVLD